MNEGDPDVHVQREARAERPAGGAVEDGNYEGHGSTPVTPEIDCAGDGAVQGTSGSRVRIGAVLRRRWHIVPKIAAMASLVWVAKALLAKGVPGAIVASFVFLALRLCIACWIVT